MHHLKLPWMDSPVSIFDICQAHLQLESDYNEGGIVRDRPSNARRNASTGVQLARMDFRPGMRWVDILSDENEDEDHDVRDIYLLNVLKWNLPISKEMQAFIGKRFADDFLQQFESWRAQPRMTE